jgi:hypothetical protein
MRTKFLVFGLLTGSFLLAGCAPPRYWHEGYRGPRYHDRDRDHRDRDHDRDQRDERPR